MSNWFFYHAGEAFNASWQLELAEKRAEVTKFNKPMFATVLDVAGEPESGDWNKIKYKGPLYFDFDLDSDEADALQVVCDNFRKFLTKLTTEFAFDLSQAYIYASGGKGFHVEIPAGCFIPKHPPAGFSGLPSIYREMAKRVIVDTLDMTVYSGRKGRMWRQPNIKRKNGNYKVQLIPEEGLEINAEKYREVVKEPRRQFEPGTPTVNAKLALEFDSCQKRVLELMKSKKRKSEATVKVLEVWKRGGGVPKVIAGLLSGENLREGAEFQKIALQAAIAATTMGWDKDRFLDLSTGLCDNHVSDGVRYNTPAKRRRELARMYDYMLEDDMYPFDPKPIAALVTRGIDLSEIGLTSSVTEEQAEQRAALEEDDPQAAILAQEQMSVRRGVEMSSRGIFKPGEKGEVQTLCRAHLHDIKPVHRFEADTPNEGARTHFIGYNADLKDGERLVASMTMPSDVFQTGANFRKALLPYQLAYQGSDSDTLGLMDVISERGRQSVPVYTLPREGLFVMRHPETQERIKVYLTKHVFRSSLKDTDPQFILQYRPSQAASPYNIDIDRAESLGPEHVEDLHKLFRINKPSVTSDVVGWFIAAHYRSLFLEMVRQFPSLQIYGEAGSGKSQTALLLMNLHWCGKELATKSAMSTTPFALDALASSSTSAPLVIDEYKPRELQKVGRGKHEKLKDIIKAAYVGGEVGERGTINRGGDTQLAIITNKATAPICFLGEAIESETAIIERSISVAMSQSFQNPERSDAFHHLSSYPQALQAFGRRWVEFGFKVDLNRMHDDFMQVLAEIRAKVPLDRQGRLRVPARMLTNRAILVMVWRMVSDMLAAEFGPEEFAADIEMMLNASDEEIKTNSNALTSVSEMSKVISRMAGLSRKADSLYEFRAGKEYAKGPDWLELRVDDSYDRYRGFCQSIGETPLFDNLTAFKSALQVYSPVVDKVCVNSTLRQGDEDNSMIVRMKILLLSMEDVTAFKG